MALWTNSMLDSTGLGAGTASHRQRSPSVGRHTAATQQRDLEWMRKTLTPVEAPGRVPEVFVHAERRSHGGQATVGRGSSISPGGPGGGRGGGGTSRHHQRNASPPVGSRQPTLVSEAMRDTRAASNSRAASFARSWTTIHQQQQQQTDGMNVSFGNSRNSSRHSSRHASRSRGGGGYPGVSVSPHRTSHQHCIPMRSRSLSRSTVSPGHFASTVHTADASRRAWTPRRMSSSAGRRNTPRWNDQLLHAADKSRSSKHRDFVSAVDRDGTAGLDVNAKFSLATYRNVQRNAGSTLPVCQTVGTDNSGCSCVEDDRGELMVHSIDLLLRANRGDGEMSPGRARLVRSGSSPVANRVENIVKKEVDRRLQKERDMLAEQQRLKDEAAAARAREAEQRHKAALMQAQAEAELANAQLHSEKTAREKAESERLAAHERIQRRQAEVEAEELRAKIEGMDTKMVSPGKNRVQQGHHPEGNAGSPPRNRAGGSWFKTGKDGVDVSTSGGAKPTRGAEEEEEDDGLFAGFNSVRRNAENSTRDQGHFDPVSSKAIQRAAQMRTNLQNSPSGSTPGAAGGTPLGAGRSTHFTGAASPGGASATSRGDVNSVVSQLASAGSSPIGNMQDVEDGMSGGGSGNRFSTPRPAAQLYGNSPGGASLLQQQQQQQSMMGHTAVVPAPNLSQLSPNFQPRLGAQGGGGMMAPTVGMKERDDHIIALMRRTQEKHRSASGSTIGTAAGVVPRPTSSTTGYDSKNASPSRYGAASGSSRHPQVFVPVAELEGHTSPAERSLFSNSGAADNNGGAAAAGDESLPPGLTSPTAGGGHGSLSATRASTSPARAGGPAYAPETLVEPPMVAGPSGLWASSRSRENSASQGRYQQ